jgi:hypothetical protein
MTDRPRRRDHCRAEPASRQALPGRVLVDYFGIVGTLKDVGARLLRRSGRQTVTGIVHRRFDEWGHLSRGAAAIGRMPYRRRSRLASLPDVWPFQPPRGEAALREKAG